MMIILNQIFQLHVQNRCLNLIQTAVATCVLKNILLLTSIVSQSTNCCGQFRIIGSNSTTITKSSKVLAGIEAMPRSISNRSC